MLESRYLIFYMKLTLVWLVLVYQIIFLIRQINNLTLDRLV